MPIEAPLGLVIARPCCLTHASRDADIQALQDGWDSLGSGSRQVPIGFFLADGNYKGTDVFVLMPSLDGGFQIS